MINIGIVGGAGYTAGELLRLLLNHPQARIVFVQSNSQAGRPITALHSSLLGETELQFVAKANYAEADLLFLCMGHGRSAAFLAEHPLPERVRIIDLSTDFRAVPNPQGFVYGLPELQRERIRTAGRIANPGCFATAIQLALLPLAKAGRLQDEVHLHALTGSTGAGQAPSSTTHFSWRDNNLSVYKAFQHQHLAEIRQSLRVLQSDFRHALNFLPLRGNFSRGIFASAYLNTDLKLEEAQELYQAFYADAPFVFLSPTNPDLKQVVNTNKGILYLERHEGKLLVISIIDNLLKGASGQAVQNMNLMFSLEETAGLKLKPSQF